MNVEKEVAKLREKLDGWAERLADENQRNKQDITGLTLKVGRLIMRLNAKDRATKLHSILNDVRHPEHVEPSKPWPRGPIVNGTSEGLEQYKGKAVWFDCGDSDSDCIATLISVDGDMCMFHDGRYYSTECVKPTEATLRLIELEAKLKALKDCVNFDGNEYFLNTRNEDEIVKLLTEEER